MIRTLFVAAALLVPGIAQAQAYRCSVPADVPRVRPEFASASEPKRNIPIGSYTLAITWAPQYCHDNADKPSASFQCGSGNRFGFTLHGLWPDGTGRTWPQYCRAADIVPQPVIKAQMCATPSAQLIQHEWAKHGTCMPGFQPARYFQHATGLYSKLRYPDMESLSRGTLTAGRFAAAMAAVNPGLKADMMRVTANRQGWLDEVWICLDTRFRYRRCGVHAGGLKAGAPLKIWRGAR